MSKALTPAKALTQSLEAMKPKFQSALPNHIPVERFVRTLQTAVINTPALVKADRNSLFASSMKAAQDGLLPDGKEAAIVTFGNQAQYMPMIGGILKKVRNSGELKNIHSEIVRKNDDFDYRITERGPILIHRPDLFGERGEIIGVYATAETKDGGIYIEVMTMTQINDIKKVSRGKNGPWAGAFASEMMKKSVLRRLCKRLPMSTDLEFTMSADDEMFNGADDIEEPVENSVDNVETPQDEPRDVSQPTSLKEKMGLTKDVTPEAPIEQDEVPL